EEPDKGSAILLKEGVQIVAVKLGKEGCYVTDGQLEYWIKAYSVKAVDATGAGDAFCAGFLHGLIEGEDIETCGRLGNLVASKKLTRTGARNGLPRREELNL
ncbi:MAG: carbohydrate kinase family protein, partial [Candidatus Bathyarchaeia archaeon]